MTGLSVHIEPEAASSTLKFSMGAGGTLFKQGGEKNVHAVWQLSTKSGLSAQLDTRVIALCGFERAEMSVCLKRRISLFFPCINFI